MRSYLSNKVHFYFFLAILFFMMTGLAIFLVLTTLVYAFIFYVFRRPSKQIFVNEFVDTDNVFSPVSGKAQQVYSDVTHPFFGKEVNAIKFKVDFLDDYGVYLPSSSEIKEIKTEKIKEINRYKNYEVLSEKIINNGIQISLKSKRDDQIGLQVLKGRLSLMPRIIVQAGDRGKALANIGLIPFGGSVIMYFDKSYKTHIKEGDDVDAGKTIIASAREKNE